MCAASSKNTNSGRLLAFIYILLFSSSSSIDNHLQNVCSFISIFQSIVLFPLPQIYVSSSMANLYQAAGVKSKKDWHLTYTGVPVLMYDKGSAKSRSAPRVTFVLAERGTCFALWKDTIDNLSSYKVSGKAFHTMCLSTGEFLSFFSQSTMMFSSTIYFT